MARSKSSHTLMVRIGCVLILLSCLGCAGFVGTILEVVKYMVRDSDAYSIAWTHLEESEEAALTLGAPVEPGWYVLGSISTGDGQGQANLQIPVEGQLATGMLLIQATQADEVWTHQSIVLVVDQTNQIIDLLASAEAADQAEHRESYLQLVDEGQALAGQGNFEAALPVFSEGLEIYPEDADLWYLRGKTHYDLENFEAAEADLAEALRLDPNHIDANSKSGQIFLQTERSTACIERFTTVLRNDPTAHAAWYYRGQCYEQLGEIRNARAGAREACQRGVTEACKMAKRLGD